MLPRIRLKTSTVLAGAAIESHHAASFRERDMVAWNPSQQSADSDLLPELPAIVSRARDIDRNNGVARGGIQTIVDNVVGTGLRLSARPNYLAIGKTKEWAEKWALMIEGLYHSWAWTTSCHAGDTMTWDQLTALQLRSQLMNGESLALPLWITDRPGDTFSTKLQTIEADRLSNARFAPDTTRLHGGIHFDAYGAPTAYDIATRHPGDFLSSLDMGPEQWTTVPRRTKFGRLKVLHVFDAERSGQSRGKPLLTAVLPQFKNADRYFQYEMQAALFNALIAGFITTEMSQDNIMELLRSGGTSGVDALGEYQALRNQNAVAMKGGTLIPLFPGDDIKPFIPQRPAAAFGNFLESVYRIIAVGLDMPYELLMKDYSKTTYSSARAAMLEAWRSFNRRRDWLGTQWADPVFDLFLEEMVNADRAEITPAEFYANRAAFTRCKWIGPGKGWVDPVKEAQAAVIRIQSNISTLEDECAQQGTDWREMLDQRAREMEYAARVGVPEPAMPGGNAPAAEDTGGKAAAAVHSSATQLIEEILDRNEHASLRAHA